jgi:type I restriction enzyme S subunit
LNSKRKFIDPITAHYLRVANVQDGYLDLSEMKTIQVERSDLERYRVHPGDVLMNEGGDLDKLGRGCLWGGQYAPCVHQNHVFVVRCNAAVLPAFLNKWTETSTARRYFMVAGKQTTNLASINKTQLGGLPIVTPPVSEQTRMVRFMNTFEKREKTEVRQLEKGKLIKQALMQDLLTGRKAVVL